MSSIKPTYDYEAVVIGGSLAGAAAAHALGRAGIQTLIIEKSVFPRRKACGEGLSARGVATLLALGLEHLFEDLPKREYQGYAFHFDDTIRSLTFNARPPDAPASFGITRRVLDTALLDAATRHPSVTLLNSKATDTLQDSDGVTTTTDEGQIRGQFLIIADGAYSSTAGGLGITHRSCDKQRFGVQFLLAGVESIPLKQVQVILTPDYEVCMTPLADSHLNVAVFGGAALQKGLHSPNFLSSIIATIHKRTGFEGEIVEAPVGVGHFGTRRRPAFSGRALLAGDSCEQLDPIGGMGMTLALESGKLAAEALIQTLRQQAPFSVARQRYQHARERAARPLRAFTSLSLFGLTQGKSHRALRGLTDGSLAQHIAETLHHPPSRTTLTEALLFTLGRWV